MNTLKQQKEVLLNEELPLLIVGRAQRKGYYIFAQPLEGKLAKAVYGGVQNEIGRENAEFFSCHFQHWGFDEKYKRDSGLNGIVTGSNPFLATLADAELRKNGLYLPSIPEADAIKKKYPLVRLGYTDFGLVLYGYGGNEDDAPIAKTLTDQSDTESIVLPAIFPFRTLSLQKADNAYGMEFSIRDLNGVIQGKEARNIFRSARMGIHRITQGSLLNRFIHDGKSNNFMFAEPPKNYLLLKSNEGGSLSWVCGEAPKERLKSIVELQLAEKENKKKRELEENVRRDLEEYLKDDRENLILLER